MADVDHHVFAKIAANRSGVSLFRIRRTQHSSDLGYDIVAFEHDRDHRGRLHELGNAREKRLVRDVTVMFREDFVGQLHHLRSANEKTRLFKSINHSTTMGFFHTIGFEEDERAFGRHGDVR